MRVVFVTRRFWPQFGSSENTIAHLAVGLKQMGAEPTVLSARWDPNWPPQVFYSDVPVVRLPRPQAHAWGTFRYLIALERWLKRHRDQMDIVCVSQLRLDAYTALRAFRRWSTPVVVRVERSGQAGDCQWQQQSRFSARLQRRFRAADALIAPDAAVAAELAAAGYDAQRIHSIPNGVSCEFTARGEDRASARSALAGCNSDLAVADDAKVVVFIGRLRQGNGLLQLVEVWPAIIRRWAHARLWIIGDGSYRDALIERIVDLEVRESVVTPGCFDDVADILNAADLFVCPSPQSGLAQALLEAAAIGIPIVASDTPQRRTNPIFAGSNAVLAPPDRPGAFCQAMLEMLEQPPPAHTVHAARRCVQRNHPCDWMVQQHRELFESLLTGRQGQSVLPQPS